MESASFREELLGARNELLHLANRLTTDYDDANDLLQETLLKALSNEEKYIPKNSIKNWMYTIMKNIFINNYRKVLREQAFTNVEGYVYDLNPPANSMVDSVEQDYERKELRKAIHALPAMLRVPLCMHISGYKYQDICEKLDLPMGTVKSRIFLAKKKLRKELKEFR